MICTKVVCHVARAAFLLSLVVTACFTIQTSDVASGQNVKTKILLVGDSTTIGGVPRKLNPDGLHLEQRIEQLAAVAGLPALEVINTGRGGETANRLLGSKWYEEHIARVPEVDYIFLRMGINDWFKCKDFQADFPIQMTALLAQLRKDHSGAKIILSTICSFMSHEDCEQVNHLIKQIAKEEGLDLFDLYVPYNQYLLDAGPNSLNIRQVAIKDIPQKYHQALKPYTRQSWWKGKRDEWVVQVNDMSIDPIFGHLEGWYGDRHPNSAGYNLIAKETVAYLDPLIRQPRSNETSKAPVQSGAKN